MLLVASSIATAACEGPEFVTVDRPVDPAAPEGPVFPYRIRVERGTDPAAVPIVFVPGGPGFEVLEQGRAYGVVPAAYTVVTTELRGIGCNAAPGVRSPASADTRNHAEDVLAALAAAGIDGFVVYGHSYGTVLGSVVASLAEQRGLHVRGALFEGTVGRAMIGDDAWFDGFSVKWEELQRAPGAQRLVRRIGRYDVGDEVWGEWLFGTLAAGNDHGGADPVLALGAGPARPLREALRSVDLSPPEPAPDVVWATRETLCRELIDESFVHARLTREGFEPFDDACGDVAVDRPWDPREWPLRAPITYLQGDADPVTPLARAVRDHAEAHPEAPRTVVIARGAGHFTAAQLGDCVGPVFAAAVAGVPVDPGACTRPLSVQVLPAR
jgi:pimeloyl-ACP methyl ester carboxylesterase